MDFLLRVITVLLFIAWQTYWLITERTAGIEKPQAKEKPTVFHKKIISRKILFFVAVLLGLQLLGFPLFVMPFGQAVQVIGFILVVAGVGVAVVARHTLGNNWAHADDYQIKQKQDLVTTGIYGYIRHPIYTGLFLALIGGELVAKSYLFIFFFVFVWGAYQQGKREEKLLESHFGKAYTEYKKRTKMLIPFIW